MAAIPNEGLNKILVHQRTLFSHLGFSTDSTAFSTGDTTLSPTGGTELILSATNANVSNAVDDYTANVTSANFGNNSIYTIAGMDGATATDILSRSVRTNPIGVEAAGDNFTVGIRVTQSDQSA